MNVTTTVTLDDKYTLGRGRVFISGTQALVRLPIIQRQRDAATGLNTAGYITGYRGSPLGIYDGALWAAQKHLDEHHIRFQSGTNEDMAATAVWGTQQVGMFEAAKYDGVFAIWYGKGPGVDRSGDPLKHGNLAGSSPNGGVLVMMGDDHGAKSSTTAHQSEPAMIAANIPVLYPASVQEYLNFGLHGFALSRFSGCWVGFKCVGDIVESSASVLVDPERVKIVTPEDFEFPEDGVHIRWPENLLEQEKRMVAVKLKAAEAYVRANGLDKVTHDAPRKRLGIVTVGKAWLDVCQAFGELGLNADQVADLGISVFKVAMPWPLGADAVTAFARGHDEILVVEEKRNIIENQLARFLYGLANDERPRLVGKSDEAGNPLVPDFGETSGAMIAQIICRRFEAAGEDSLLASAQAALKARGEASNLPSAEASRTVWFCAGCPHNTSTRVPEGSRAHAGIGCHTMAMGMNRDTAAYTHMGGEGGTWIGQAPFTTAKHVFQNMGDGTYFHSGIMGVRAAIAAGVNITFKILYNDAVAMTGGQPVEGSLMPWEISQQLRAERVGRIVVVTDEPDKYPARASWASGVAIRHRSELDAVQRELREIPGVTALIYDQTCAAEKRRRRKRGRFPDPPKRAFINDLVCEGCGDCGLVSNCVAIKPLETPFGRKREVDQSNCNKDYSCVDGFCPSFVTIHGGGLRRTSATNAAGIDGGQDPAEGLNPPAELKINGVYNVLLTGIGGTGVITVGALLGMAAHIDGKGCTVLDMTGLAQKNGAVTSHIRLSDTVDGVQSTRIGSGMSDLVLGFDMVVAAGADAVMTMASGRTRAIINDHLVPIAAFTQTPDMALDSTGIVNVISTATGAEKPEFIDATRLATALMGDSIMANIFLVGYALQKGALPLSLDAIRAAIELNGVAVEANLHALDWGRLAAVDLGAVENRIKEVGGEGEPEPVEETLDEALARRVAALAAYQNEAYADEYAGWVGRIREAEENILPGETALAEAVVRSLFKLMAYKDEYEVARLFTEGTFQRKLAGKFEGDFKLRFHMAPPIFARPDPLTGHLRKMSFGGWMMPVLGVLARLKGLRGSVFDPFGYSAERRVERRLIADYQSRLEEILAALSPANHGAAIGLAALPESIRGFGHVKAQTIIDAKEQEAGLLAEFRGEAPIASAAE